MYIQEEGGRAKKECNALKQESERDESTEEQLQCNEQYKCTPHGTLSPLSPAMAMPEHPYPCMKPLKHESMSETPCDMRYTNSLTPSPTVANSSTAKRI